MLSLCCSGCVSFAIKFQSRVHHLVLGSQLESSCMRKTEFSFLWQSLACSSLSWFGAPLRFHPFTLVCLLVLCLFRSFLGSHIVEVSQAWSPCRCYNIHGLTGLPLTLLRFSPSLRCSSCVIDGSVQAGHSTIS